MDSGRALGVIGGGGSARLLLQAAHRYGIRTLVLDPAGSASSAGQIAELSVEAAFDDIPKLREFASICDVLYINAEAVTADVTLELEEVCREVQPSAAVLSILRDRLVQNSFFRSNGLRTPECFEIDNLSSAREAGVYLGYPLVLRSHTKSVLGRASMIREETMVEEAYEHMVNGVDRVFAESAILMAKQLVVTLVRTRAGEEFYYPVAEAVDGIMLSPARISFSVENASRALAAKAIDVLGNREIYGVFAVTVYVTDGDSLILGNVSARPQLAGDCSLDACRLSQYDAFLRILLHLPLPADQEDVHMRGVMTATVHLRLDLTEEGSLDKHRSLCQHALTMGGCYLHWYGSSCSTIGDRVGHITMTAESIPLLLSKLEVLGVGSSMLKEEGTIRAAASVAIVVNSKHDLAYVMGAARVFELLDITYDVSIASAHLTPSRVYAFSQTASDQGYAIIIGVSRGEPHLANMISSLTSLPVIAQLIPEHTESYAPSMFRGCQDIREGSPIGCIASRDGSDVALFAARVLAAGGSGHLSGVKKQHLKVLLLQRNAEKEAGALRDALRLDSVGFKEYIENEGISVMLQP